MLTIFLCHDAFSQLPWPIQPTNQIKRLFAGYGTFDDFTPQNTGIHLHEGLDILVDSGTRVVASEAGRVVFAQVGQGYASAVFVSRRGNTNEALCYIHINVANNRATGRAWAVTDSVNVGDTLGTVTRNRPIPAHLHFDWRRKLAAEQWIFFMSPFSLTPTINNFLPEFNGNPIDLLTPLTDQAGNRPAFSNPIHYRSQTGNYFTTTISSRDTVIQGNVDIVARISETFGPAATTSYNIGPKRIDWNVQEYKPGNTASIATQTPVNFTGRFLQQEPSITYRGIQRPHTGGSAGWDIAIPAAAGTGRNTHWKFYKNYQTSDAANTYEAIFGDLIYTMYSRDATCRSVPRDPAGTDRGVYWYILTNIDDTNNVVESRDSAYYWDTNGREAQAWNDKRDNAPNEADSNKNAAFPDGRYILTIRAQGYGNAADSSARKDTVSINNFNEFIYSCTSNGTLKDTFCIGDPVYIKGKGFPKSRSFRVFVIKDRTWPDGANIPNDANRVAAVTVTSDANGWIPPTRVWAAYAANSSPDRGYDIVLDYNWDSLYSTSKLTRTVDVLDESPLPFSIIGGTPKIQKSKTDVKCYGECTGAITLTVTGGRPPYTYYWNDHDTAIDQSYRDSLCAGQYWVTVVDANGCVAVDTTTITQPAQKLQGSGTSTNSKCGQCNGTATITATGGTAPYYYSWYGGTQYGLCAGTYTGIVWDANGCTDTVEVTVYEDPSTLSVSCSATNSKCGQCNGTATMTATGGTGPYYYSWYDGTMTNLCPGTYYGTVWDANGCSDTCSVTIYEDSSTLQANCYGVDANCGVCDGSATITASGGTPPYYYSWPGGTLTGLCPGTYTGYVTDSTGCYTSCTVTIGNRSSTLSVSCLGTDATCGQCNGTATLTASGGTAPYYYSWPGGTLNGLCAGTYTGSVTDANGCTASCSVTISETYSGLYLNCWGSSASCDSCNGTVSMSASGGTAPYTYSWPGGTLSGLCPGSYYGSVTDANGCTAYCWAYVSGDYRLCDTIKVDTTIGHDTIKGDHDLFRGKTVRQETIQTIRVFPNPFDAWINVQFYSTEADNTYISLQNVTGNMVRTYKTTAVKGNNTFRIDGKGLARGIYFIRIGNEVFKVYRQ